MLSGFRAPGLGGTIALLPRAGLGTGLDALGLLLGLEFSGFVAFALLKVLAFRLLALGQVV